MIYYLMERLFLICEHYHVIYFLLFVINFVLLFRASRLLLTSFSFLLLFGNLCYLNFSSSIPSSISFIALFEQTASFSLVVYIICWTIFLSISSLLLSLYYLLVECLNNLFCTVYFFFLLFSLIISSEACFLSYLSFLQLQHIIKHNLQDF